MRNNGKVHCGREDDALLWPSYVPSCNTYPKILISVSGTDQNHVKNCCLWGAGAGIATGYGLDGRCLIPNPGERCLSSSERPDRIWGPPSLLCNGFFSAGKSAGTWSLPLIFIWCRRQEWWSYISIHTPMPSCRRDNFTLAVPFMRYCGVYHALGYDGLHGVTSQKVVLFQGHRRGPETQQSDVALGLSH
jgi:hypothetical protein